MAEKMKESRSIACEKVGAEPCHSEGQHHIADLRDRGVSQYLLYFASDCGLTCRLECCKRSYPGDDAEELRHLVELREGDEEYGSHPSGKEDSGLDHCCSVY